MVETTKEFNGYSGGDRSKIIIILAKRSTIRVNVLVYRGEGVGRILVSLKEGRKCSI